ncbi:ATP-binding cassette domain-containing protein [Pleionea sediminis]|uniref:ATP-binding cassette domain-containing protein n=1 Tax=Pleionea sediminis TaxID=2569479 RepID=UPI00118524B2|nr:ATP-binding cassette domain-containing protein [Pleionea sediminis]
MITCSKVSYSRGAKTLVEDLDVTFFQGEKIGIVGPNGCGKSTLFQLILGELHADTGNFDIPSKLKIAHVRQETPGMERTAIDYVLDGDKDLRIAQAELMRAEKENDGEAIAKAHQSLEFLGAYDAESRAAKLLFGLGFSDELMQANVSELSGGWRVRLNLAQALIQSSDLLLLDEPTNHLDLDAVFWLESFLRSYPGTLLIISHDRDFLDAIVSKVLHFERGKVKAYSGNYSEFIKLKAERESLQAKQYEKQQSKIAHLQSFIDRFKAKASKAKQAQSRVKALERMATVENIQVREKLSFDFYEPKHKPDPLLRFEKINAGYGEEWILNNVNFSIRCDSRIGLLGRNGAGKSTLLKTIAQTEVTTEGSREASKHLNVGYFAQHQLEQLNGQQSAFDQLIDLDPDLSEQEVRNYLGGFAFHGDKVFENVENFSGGEKARLVLALVIYQRPNLILLDEPTNHLDMEMRDALTLAIQNFSGAVILISHDRYLLDATVDELYLVDSGQVNEFNGDTQYYHQWLKQNRWGSDKSAVDSSNGSTKSPAVDRKAKKQAEAKVRQMLAPIKKNLDKAEKRVEKLQSELGKLETEMADSSLYESDRKDDLSRIIDRQSQLKSELTQAEDEWFEFQEEYESESIRAHAEHGID